MGRGNLYMDDCIGRLSYQCVRAGADKRALGFCSGWRRFPNTLITQIRGGEYSLETTTGAWRVKCGEGFLIPCSMRTQVSLPGTRLSTTVYSHFHCRVYGAFDLFRYLQEPLLFDKKTAARIGSLNEDLIRMQAGTNLGPLLQTAEIQAIGFSLLSVVLQAAPALEQAWQDPEALRLLPVVEHIQNHVHESINRGDLARLAGLSAPRFHVVFSKAFGLAPMVYVREERLRRARHLLLHTHLSIGEIAAMVGFADPLYFSRAFCRAEGLSPRAYRQQVRREFA